MSMPLKVSDPGESEYLASFGLPPLKQGHTEEAAIEGTREVLKTYAPGQAIELSVNQILAIANISLDEVRERMMGGNNDGRE
jgi:hypothetical protein